MRNIPLIFFFIYFSACAHTEIKKPAFDFYPPVTDSLRDKYLKRDINQAIKIFNLTDLTNGVDSFEIRIRPQIALDIFVNLFVFKINGGKWEGFHYNSFTMPIERIDGVIMRYSPKNIIKDSFLIKKIIPLCGWDKFSDSLAMFKLNSLPAQFLIKNFEYKGHTDGHGYIVEIATRHSYRLLYYDMPEWYSYGECKTFSNFIAFLKKQLGKDYYWPEITHGIISSTNKKPA